MMAHITYVSEGALETKFGRAHQQGTSTPGLGVDFSVESYLDHQAAHSWSASTPPPIST